MKTFQDLQALGDNEKKRMQFILAAIAEHKASEDYKIAQDAELYATGRNATIMAYQKILYNFKGEAVKDLWSANHKCASAFFKRFVIQQVSTLLGNGITFENEETEKALGKTFGKRIIDGAKKALRQKVVFGFFNKDHIEIYDFLSFVPLIDEEDGALKAGIRFWQIDDDKPLRMTLFEMDGYTDYIKRKDEEITVRNEKRAYIIGATGDQKDVEDGTMEYVDKNYPHFPIVPFYANTDHQSELVGIREQIDCYDLIKSGFANDVDEASAIYWTIQNASGMDDVDLAKFVERMRTVRAAAVEDDGAKAEAHTVDVPYQAREAALSRLEKDLYKDAMALDVEQIAAGSVTATQIKAAYEPLNEKLDDFEYCVTEFIQGILAVAGIEDTPTYTRSIITNTTEMIENIIAAGDYLDEDYITEKLLTVLGDADKVEEVLKRRAAEKLDRYTELEEENEALKQEADDEGAPSNG